MFLYCRSTVSVRQSQVHKCSLGLKHRYDATPRDDCFVTSCFRQAAKISLFGGHNLIAPFQNEHAVTVLRHFRRACRAVRSLRPSRDARHGATPSNEHTHGACYLRRFVLSFYLVLSAVAFVSHGISPCDPICPAVPEGSWGAAPWRRCVPSCGGTANKRLVCRHSGRHYARQRRSLASASIRGIELKRRKNRSLWVLPSA